MSQADFVDLVYSNQYFAEKSEATLSDEVEIVL